MSFVNISQCADKQEFIKLLDAIEITLSILRTVEKPLIDKISKFFDCNIKYIEIDAPVANRTKVITNFLDDPLVGKVHKNALSVLKKNANDYIKSLANGINHMEIPLSSLNLSEQDLYNLLPWLRYIDFSNLDLSKYDVKKYNFDLHTDFILKASDNETLFNIAKPNAQLNPYTTSKYIKKFGIEDKSHLFDIAKLCVEQSPSQTLVNIKNFDFDDAQLLEIAKLSILWAGVDNGFLDYLDKFGFSDAPKFEIIKFCIQKDITRTIKYIERFEFNEKTYIYEIAKLCAHTEVHETAEFFKNFGIEDKIQLLEIAKLCARKSGWITAGFIKNFGIEDKTDLFEIAKICAQQDGNGTCLNIKNFELEDKTHLFEIAKLCATHPEGRVSSRLTSFGIEDESHLYEIAKLCAQNSGSVTAINIEKFGITDVNKLFEIAKLCAQKDGIGTARYIKNFGIEDKVHLFEIAKLCFEIHVKPTFEYFNNFGIENKTHLYEIAKICAKRDGHTTAFNIKSFGIADKGQLFEIAILCAHNAGNSTAMFIKDFGIEDKLQIYKIAKACFRQNVEAVLHINNFKFDEEHLYKIAKISAQKAGAETAYYINNFKIKDPIKLVEIAKLCAQQNANATTNHIKKFGIKDETQLLEIAKLCAQQSGETTAKYLYDFGFSNAQLVWEVLLECMVDKNALWRIENNRHVDSILREYNIKLLAGLLDKILNNEEVEGVVTRNKIDLKENRIRFFKEINTLIDKLSCSNENKEKLIRFNEQISNLPIHILHVTALWFLRTLCYSIQMQTIHLDWMLQSKLWDELARLREPRLRSLLTAGLFELSKKNRDVHTGTHGLPLIAIPLFQLEEQRVPPEKLKLITKTLKSSRHHLKNVLTVQCILHTFHLLAATFLLSTEEKIKVIDKIFNNKKGSAENNIQIILNRINAVRALLELKKYKILKSAQDPVAAFSGMFEKLIPITSFKGDISVEYDKIFAKSRNPYGLITYASRLQTLLEPQVMECLGLFVSSVFDGSFKGSRYQTVNNLHLQTISESRQDLLEIWKKDIEKPLVEVSPAEEKKEAFDPKKWLWIKLIKDEHLGKTEIPYIKAYFQKNTTEEKKLVLQNLTEELQKAPNDLLMLQQACIAFAEETSENFNPLLKKIQVYLDPNAEFANDIKSLLDPKRELSNLNVIFTDDPIDLLLCGTDVMGSCQRLDGHANLNKGLLGYLVDGKIRLLAIKEDKGKIITRCLLRLLWDGERPVLYRERFYPDDRNSKHVSALNELAMDLAKAMNLPLTSADNGTAYGKPLQSLAGAVYEYCDGGEGGVKKGGVYTITNANIKIGEV